MGWTVREVGGEGSGRIRVRVSALWKAGMSLALWFMPTQPSPGEIP